MKYNIKVSAMEHENVNGKKQNYLKLENENGSYLIKVGEKTIRNIEALCKM
jgi:hypothetical protein